jgi:hypothetical protein
MAGPNGSPTELLLLAESLDVTQTLARCLDIVFTLHVLRMKSFPSIWCQWMEKVVTKGSVGVQVNDDLGHFFQTKKGLRQGDPLSPNLFNLVANMLTVLIERSKILGFFDGLVPHLVENGLSILLYADDTILFLDDDFEKAKGLKVVLSAFEKLSGLKINFHKSELFCFGENKRDLGIMFDFLAVKRASFVTTLPEIIPYYRLNHSIWSLSDNKEVSH